MSCWLTTHNARVHICFLRKKQQNSKNAHKIVHFNGKYIVKEPSEQSGTAGIMIFTRALPRKVTFALLASVRTDELAIYELSDKSVFRPPNPTARGNFRAVSCLRQPLTCYCPRQPIRRPALQFHLQKDKNAKTTVKIAWSSRIFSSTEQSIGVEPVQTIFWDIFLSCYASFAADCFNGLS